MDEVHFWISLIMKRLFHYYLEWDWKLTEGNLPLTIGRIVDFILYCLHTRDENSIWFEGDEANSLILTL
jgi:hypothetical protein